ncbi:DNA mismatch repair protein MutS [Empedobacter stercoris]|uniref:DNA mismatch repair protein MutS n=1 Tax=Empedobacter falsenii TaxID=343874 RepID=A0ABY8V6B9_9FLAO|nr:MULTISPECIES: DNA mismatch repair protein MutS [Empedobacter]UWX66860.1 DNA mismatch repair protein MutS [Empedobacter stercoris]WIH97038.1 DNA mismatch repair protein MutS [Empedobacter falsenii]HJD86812.1 DNA mismatch repair protein MutS [Empedobacter falsenii]
MKQYNQIKAKYPDAMLLFRVGDFYETFGEDAVRASRILDIVLTKRANGSDNSELAGFPHHSLNTYLPKLVKAGLRVAICDQLEDPKTVKGIVKRGVTELITPGVALQDEVLSSKSNNFLMAVHEGSKSFGIALLDVSTGEFLVSEGQEDQVAKIIQSFRPSEVIYQKRVKYNFSDVKSKFLLDDWAFQYDFAIDKLTSLFKTKNLKGFGIEDLKEGIISAGAILAYLDDTHHFEIQHITSIQRLNQENFVWMDPFTIRNLELVYSPHPKGVTLLNILDDTKTPMGARLLNRWMVMVLKDLKSIQRRQNIVEYFYKFGDLRYDLREKLAQLTDLERLAGKVSTGKITPRQLLQLAQSLKISEDIKEVAEQSNIKEVSDLFRRIEPIEKLTQKIFDSLTDEPPHQIVKGNVIREGISEELDRLRKIQFSGKDFLDQMCQRETERTGISSLKIAFNNVFGYYIEVRNTHKDKVPEEWIRKQTLVNAERYITEELKEYETQILGAEEKILAIENQLFIDLLQEIITKLLPIQQIAKAIAFLDVLSTFAEIAEKNSYSKPSLNDGFELNIKEGRHAVIEQQLPIGEQYVSNNVELNSENQQIIMITGPNMSGKSALLRQTALIVLMAQMGSFVPAQAAKLGIIDKVFTRVGASDNISSGESTFMVEMNETASILNNISERSLILLDEIGRGTSTYDGISIAWAIAEFLHQSALKPKTLFATHYHELNEMSKSMERIKNFNVSIKETKDTILFLRKLVPGGSEHSFGIHVAKMAGMPKRVVDRANDVLKVLEATKTDEGISNKTEKITQDNMQLSFFQLDDPILESIREEIMNTDINTLTPVEALMKLNEIKKKLGK